MTFMNARPALQYAGPVSYAVHFKKRSVGMEPPGMVRRSAASLTVDSWDALERRGSSLRSPYLAIRLFLNCMRHDNERLLGLRSRISVFPSTCRGAILKP